jgi:hypothetical protein
MRETRLLTTAFSGVFNSSITSGGYAGQRRASGETIERCQE